MLILFYSRYIYYEKALLTGQNILTILYCAKKYMISGLEKLCREFLEDQMDHSNVCFILEQVCSSFILMPNLPEKRSL